MSLLHAERRLQAVLVFRWQLSQQVNASDLPQPEWSNYEAEHLSSKHLRQLITIGSFVSICVAPVIAADSINQVNNQVNIWNQVRNQVRNQASIWNHSYLLQWKCLWVFHIASFVSNVLTILIHALIIYMLLLTTHTQFHHKAWTFIPQVLLSKYGVILAGGRPHDTMLQCNYTMQWWNAMTQCNDTMQWHNAMIQCNDPMQWYNAMTQCNDAMQVAYTAMIPCMLFTKCAATLASSRSWVLITLPLTAVLQVTPPPRISLYIILMLPYLYIFCIWKNIKCVFRFFLVIVSCWLTQLAWDIASWSHDSIQQVLLAPRVHWRWLQVCPLTWSPGWHSIPVPVTFTHVSGGLWWYILKCYGILHHHMAVLRACKSVWETSQSVAE